MKNLFHALIVGLALFLATVGAAVVIGGCITPEKQIAAESELAFSLVDTLDRVGRGELDGDQMVAAMKQGLQDYGNELRTAVIQDTAAAVSREIESASDKAAGIGGAVGLAGALATLARAELAAAGTRRRLRVDSQVGA